MPVTLSVGLVDTGGEVEATALLKKADRALYRAKSEGRARAVLFDPKEDTAQAVDNPVEMKTAAP